LKFKVFCSLTNSFHSKTASNKSNDGAKTSKSDDSPLSDKNSSLKNVPSATSSSNDTNADKSSKYFADTETLYILGKQYTTPIDEDELAKDVQSRIWLTYRKGFSQINGNGPDSDQGWGCMIRCGQMLLAETFLRLYLGRDFSWVNGVTGDALYWKILSYFRDEKLAPYSIQQIAMMGVSEGIPIGKWFGPNAIAQVLNKLTTYEESNHLRFYIAMDNCIFVDEIYESMKKCNKCIKCKQHPKGVSKKWDPLLLIIPLRLGLYEFDSDYKESIKVIFFF